MSDVTTTFSITLSMNDLIALLARSMNREAEVPPLVAVAEPAANPPSTRSHRATRAAQQANGQADPAREQSPVAAAPVPASPEPAPARAPTVLIPTEEALRPLLSRMAAVHVDKVKGVTEMLERVGGHKRLVECPPDTWPAIKQACDDAIAAAGG